MRLTLHKNCRTLNGVFLNAKGIFNIIAILLLSIPLFLQYHFSGDNLWLWRGYFEHIPNGCALAAILAFLWTLKYYSANDFTGIKQLREGKTETLDQEQFIISPLHRYVRHPWYFLLLIILWTRSMDQARLISTVLITIYLTLGSRLEENKLLVYFGEQYKSYKNQVPGLIPLPWKYLKKTE